MTTTIPDNSALAVKISTAKGSKIKFTSDCNYCGIKGHKKEQCYRLIRFPPNFKFTKGKKHDSQAHQVSIDPPQAVIQPLVIT